MTSSLKKLSAQNLTKHVRSFLFFLGFYLYLWLVVDLRLIYHGGGAIEYFPVFYRGWAFFQEFISEPAGLIKYLSAFLSQFFYYSWAGGLVAVLQAWLIFVCTDYILKAVNALSIRWVRFIPPILLLILYNQYTYHFTTVMALLVALAFVCLYLKVNPRSKLFALLVFLVLSVMLYTIAGGAYLLFAMVCAICELFFRHRWQTALIYLLFAAVIPYVEGVLIFGISIINAFTELLPISWKLISHKTYRIPLTTSILYLLLPLATLGFGFWHLLGEKKRSKKAGTRPSMPQVMTNILSWYTGTPGMKWIVESVILLLAAGIGLFFSYDYKRRTLFQVDYYASHKMWPQVLSAARSYPASYEVAHAVNRALYHTGRLTNDMFSYLQHPDMLLLPVGDIFTNWKRFGTHLELGHMNFAEDALIISLEIFGERPVILKNMALVNMAKGDINAARIYLGALSKTLFDADWANHYLELLESDPNLSTDQHLQHLRSLVVEKDYGFTSFGTIEVLPDLLKKNPRNKMAFEYLMAKYLLTKQLDKFVQNLNRLDDFGYVEIPSLYEEAVLIYESHTGEKVDLGKHQIPPESRQRYKNFMQIYYTQNKKTALKELARNYGDSFVFYYTYGFSGIKK